MKGYRQFIHVLVITTSVLLTLMQSTCCYELLQDDALFKWHEKPQSFETSYRDVEVADDVEPETEHEHRRVRRSAWWTSRNPPTAPKNSAAACNYVWYKFQCNSGCCWRLTKEFGECLPCQWRFYLFCGRFLNPPIRGNILPTATAPTSDRSNWMQAFQNRLLKQLILPGSHHSGINRDPGKHILDSWDIPQTMSISNQLKAGIRYLDIRVSTGPFLRQATITHNYHYQRFENVVRDTVNFLKLHTSEVVVMSLTGGQSNAIYYGVDVDWETNWRQVDRILTRYAPNVYSGSNPLDRTVSQLKGKIVICQKFRTSSLFAMDCRGSFSDTETNNPDLLPPRITTWVNTRPNYSNVSFYFVDALLTPSEDDIIDSVNPFNCNRNGTQRIYEFRSIKDMALSGNYKINQWIMGRNDTAKVGAIIADFVHPLIINATIAMN